jgi:calcyclin binding protein
VRSSPSVRPGKLHVGAELQDWKRALEVVSTPTAREAVSLHLKQVTEKLAASGEEKPAVAATGTPAASASTSESSFERLTVSWDQDDAFVNVYILSGVDGVGALPESAVRTSFSHHSFDLQIFGPVKKRALYNNLERDIDPEGCKVLIKKNRVTLRLKKAGRFEHWSSLESKKKRAPTKAPAASEAVDPSAGLLNVIRDLYDGGDDDMKRTIAQAWTSSQDARKTGTGIVATAEYDGELSGGLE